WMQTTDVPAPITVGLTDHITGVDFGNFQTVTLSGTVFNDLNGNGAINSGEPGQGGFTIDLINAATNQVVATAPTASNGAFVFNGVGPLAGGGAYLIREESQAGFVQTTTDPAAFAPTSGTDVSTFLFGTF